MTNPSSNALSLLQCYSDSDSETEEVQDGNNVDTVVKEFSSKDDIKITDNCADDRIDKQGCFNDSNTASMSSERSAPEIVSDCTMQVSEGTKLQDTSQSETKAETSMNACSESTTPLKTKEEIVKNPTLYRVQDISDSESDSSSEESDHNVSVVSTVDIADDIDDEDVDEKDEGQGTKKKTRMLEALGIADLPPIEELTITVPHEECIPIGKISNIIDSLVIITANKGTPAIDLDSVLFLCQGAKTLGRVFDVFGPVSEPLYMVRFNSGEDIVNKEITIGLDVYYAPRTRHTAFVFLDSLIKMKGSDASWEHDQEPPENCLDYSDDEEERKAKAAIRMKKSGASGDPQAITNPRKSKRQRPDHPRYPPGPRGQRQYAPPNPFYMRGPAPSTGPSSVYANYSGHPASNVWPSPSSSWAGRLPPPTWAVPAPGLQQPAFPATDPIFGPHPRPPPQL